MKIVLKVIVTLLLWGGVNYFMNVFQPGMTRDVALSQMENTEASFTNYASWRQVMNFVWVLYILPLLLFIPEIKSLKNGTKTDSKNDTK